VNVVHAASRSRGRLRRSWDSEWFDLVVAMTTSWLLLIPTGLLDMPPTIDRLTIENPTVYDIHIDASDEEGDGWVAVTTVGRQGTGSTTNVIDQGDVWRFRFRGQGRDGGELTVARTDLEADGWELTIPDAVGERLAELGAPPSPP